MDAAVRSAAVSVGVQIALLCVGPIGQAISGLMSLVQMVTGQIYARQIKNIIANTIEAIKARSAAAQQRVTDAGNAVCVQEFPTAKILAMNGQPLNGLDSWFTSLRNSIENVVKVVPASVKKVVLDPQSSIKFLTTITSPVGIYRLVTKDVEKVAISAAKDLETAGLAKEGSLSQPLYKIQDQTDSAMYSLQKLTSPLTTVQESAGLVAKDGGAVVAAVMTATGHPSAAKEVLKIAADIHATTEALMPVASPIGAYNLFSGRDGYLAAKDACIKMQADAFAAIDAEAAATIKKIQSPEGHQATRIALAQALRNDPEFMRMADELRTLESQQAQLVNTPVNAVAQAAGPPSSGAGTLVGIAAAAAAAFAISR